MGFDHAADATGHDHAPTHASQAPGRRTLTQGLPRSGSGAAPAVDASPPATAAAGHEDPFAVHLLDDGVAIEQLLERTRSEAQGAFDRLVADEDRNRVIGSSVPVIVAQLVQLQGRLADLETPLEAARHAAALERASAPVLAIRHWLDQRQATRGMQAMFSMFVVDRLDRIREKLGLVPIGDLAAPAMPQKEVEEAGQEQRDIDAAASALHAKIITFMKGFERGNTLFKEHAALKRPPPPPSFWAELAKGIVISVIGNLAGPIGGMLGTKLVGKVMEKGAKQIGELIAGTVTDSVEAIASKVADGALDAVGSPNQATRDVVLFSAMLSKTQDALNEQTWLAIDTAVKNKTTSAQTLRAVAAGMDQNTVDIANVTYQQAAHGYALIQARQGLGVLYGRDGEVSDTRDYQGTASSPDVMGVPLPREGDKRGTTGVGRLEIAVDDRDGIPSIEVRRFRINGMNDDLAVAVLARADHRLRNLGLPLEIAIEPYQPGPLRPMLIVDETGTLTDVLDWKGWKIGQPGSFQRRPQTGDLDGPGLWSWLRNLPLPKSAARIDKGG